MTARRAYEHAPDAVEMIAEVLEFQARSPLVVTAYSTAFSLGAEMLRAYAQLLRQVEPVRAVIEAVAEKLLCESGDCAQEAPLYPRHMADFLSVNSEELAKALAILDGESKR